MFVRPQFLPWPSTGVCYRFSGYFASRGTLPGRRPGSVLLKQSPSGSGVNRLDRRKPYYFTYLGLHHAGPLPVDPFKISSCNVTSHFQVRSTWYNSNYRVTTPETDRVCRKLDTRSGPIFHLFKFVDSGI